MTSDKKVVTKGFETEQTANDFAEKVGGTVEFRPLPDYMAMIPYYVVRYEKDETC